MAKNKRQPYAVSEKAGHQTSAESWGTGERTPQMAPEHQGRLVLTCSRSRCCPYSTCLRRRYTPCRSSGVWEHVPFGSHVCTHQGLEKVASKDQSGTKVGRRNLLEGGDTDLFAGALLPPLLWPHPPSRLSSLHVAIKSLPCQKCPWSSLRKLSKELLLPRRRLRSSF